jgi:hypothetical protein
MGSPVSEALSIKQRIASLAISRASSRVSPEVQISGIAGTITLYPPFSSGSKKTVKRYSRISIASLVFAIKIIK